jgi:hypothetical protein
VSFTDFYINNNGSASNLNAGSTSADAAVYTSTAGNWDGTSVFTPTDGQTTTTLVSVGDWASIYPTGNTVTPYVAQVTAVGAGVNGTITLSTAKFFGTAPASNSGSRNCKTGGAWFDLGIVASGAALNTGTVTQSTRVNIKAGTYANTTTARAFALAGLTTAPLWWRGYKTTIGDQDSNNAAVAGTDIPAITFTTVGFTVTSAFQIFSNLDITSAITSTGAVVINGASCDFYHFRSTNTAGTANSCAIKLSVQADFTSCYFKTTTTSTALVSITGGNNTHFTGCVFTSGLVGLQATTQQLGIAFCVFDSQASDAIQATTGALTVVNCSIYSPAGNGINWTGAPGACSMVVNCYFDSVSTAAKAAIMNSSGTNTGNITCVGNAYYNCTANTSGLGDFPLIFDNGTLSGSAFVAPASQNFSINTLGASIGFPGSFETTSAYQGYIDIGAVQRAPGGGSNITVARGDTCYPAD